MSPKRKGIQTPDLKRGPNILPPSDTDMAPAFGFFHTAPGYGLADVGDGDRLAYLEHIHRRSQMTWGQMYSADHRKLGLEAIPLKAILVSLPPWLTKEHTILVLRCGGRRRMIGYREGRVFVALWLDVKMAVYYHGS